MAVRSVPARQLGIIYLVAVAVGVAAFAAPVALAAIQLEDAVPAKDAALAAPQEVLEEATTLGLQHATSDGEAHDGGILTAEHAFTHQYESEAAGHRRVDANTEGPPEREFNAGVPSQECGAQGAGRVLWLPDIEEFVSSICIHRRGHDCFAPDLELEQMPYWRLGSGAHPDNEHLMECHA